MKTPDDPRTPTATIRHRAEEITKFKDKTSPQDLKSLSPNDVQTLLHELKVHELELEMQNEELHRVQHELETSHARYVDLYDNAPVGYFSIDEAGVIEGANVTAAHLLGIDRPQLAKEPLSRFIVFDDQDIYYLHRKRLFATGERQVFELRLLRPDASSFWARIEATLELTSAKGPRCRAIVSDITERKRADGEQARLLSQLAQAQKLEAIGTLAGGIAHDFNNILSGILCGLSLLELETELDRDSLQRGIDEMKLLVERAANLTRQLLGFARRGRYDVRPLNVDLVARRTLEMFGRARKDITLVIENPPCAAAVQIDHTQLEQVLLNLFINAGQAMPSGGTLSLVIESVELTREVSESHGIEPGRFVKLIVKDTGVGMSAETLLRIFEPFFTTKGRGTGTGLGLAAVYGIVKSHGGVVRVESEPGQGSMFTVFLPATDRIPEKEEAPPESIKPGAGTVLIVDDEEQITNLTARLLSRIGYNVLTASSGKQAIELVRQRGPEISLIILDMIMPEMSGSQTYSVIKELGPHIKVLLASGYSVEGEAEELLERGCNGFIQKPFSIADLSAKLKALL